MTDPAPYIFDPGDLGEYVLVQVTVTASGEPVYQRKWTKPAKYTGGKNADGSWTLADGWEKNR